MTNRPAHVSTGTSGVRPSASHFTFTRFRTSDILSVSSLSTLEYPIKTLKGYMINRARRLPSLITQLQLRSTSQSLPQTHPQTQVAPPRALHLQVHLQAPRRSYHQTHHPHVRTQRCQNDRSNSTSMTFPRVTASPLAHLELKNSHSQEWPARYSASRPSPSTQADPTPVFTTNARHPNRRCLPH